MSPFLGTRGAGSNRAFGYAGAGAPAQVAGLTATDFGTSRAYNNGRIDLSWSTPANNGATITGYKIERSTNGSSYSTLVANTGSSATTYSDTSLLSAQIYYYKVSAINAAGTGLTSTAANATATTVPQTPVIGTVTRTNNTTVSLPFTINDGGSSITSYTVTGSPSVSITVSGTSSPLTVSSNNFDLNTNYTFTVSATNANGTSATSSVSNSVIVRTGYALGDTGPGGGKIFYDAGSTLSWGRYLEAASLGWADAQVDWQEPPQGDFVSGTSTAIGTGVTNTNLMLAAKPIGAYSGSYAGTRCRSFTQNGKTWSLPSRDEMVQMYVNRSYLSPFGAAVGVSDEYYSSSDNGTNSVHIVFMNNGTTGLGSKNASRGVRAFRPI